METAFLERADSGPGTDFSPWLYCVAVVSFHATRGHVLETVHPKHQVRLPEEELRSIAHFSLPDTTIDTEGDISYSFRYRTRAGGFSYGAVFFRQSKDASSTRGYMQKSLVAVCRSAESLHVASEFVRVLAPLLFAYGDDILEVACAECKSWPAPIETGNVLAVAGTQIVSQPYPSAHLFQDIPLFSTFGSLSVALWLLWELVLTGQQVLILGPTPDRCSKAVLGVCSLIAPIPLALDFRPFFTLFDADFAALSHPENKAPMVIGGTNPFLLRSLEHFPNVVSLGSQRSENEETHVARRNQPLRSLLRNRRWERSIVLTREEPLVARDEKLIASLRRIGSDPKTAIHENNERLRRTFRDLTRRLLLPLQTFIRSHPIGEKAAHGGLRVSAYQDEVLRERQPFSVDSFVAYLSSKTAKRDPAFPIALYKRFLAGPNFAPWLEAETQRLTLERSRIVRSLIVHTDVDILLRMSSLGSNADFAPLIERALQGELAKTERDDELCARMTEHLHAIQRVPSDGI
jgi:hypothetical protein